VEEKRPHALEMDKETQEETQAQDKAQSWRTVMTR
jgi:hypothetical protein